jgi:hypothetical protein
MNQIGGINGKKPPSSMVFRFVSGIKYGGGQQYFIGGQFIEMRRQLSFVVKKIASDDFLVYRC